MIFCGNKSVSMYTRLLLSAMKKVDYKCSRLVLYVRKITLYTLQNIESRVISVLQKCLQRIVINLYLFHSCFLQQRTVMKEDVHQRNPPKFEKTEDMANLTYLSEAAILHNLRERYHCWRIYVSSDSFVFYFLKKLNQCTYYYRIMRSV